MKKTANKNLIEQALNATNEDTKDLIPESLFSGTNFFFDEKGNLCHAMIGENLKLSDSQ